MKDNKRFFSLATKADRTADLYIFGDIVAYEFLESDMSSYTLAKKLQALDVDAITVHINSYGGEVAEGLAIYNSLKNHPAKVTTVCDGFACSAASVVFMAGDERLMNPASLLMIHNAWVSAVGNAEALRKAADDIETISDAAAEVYRVRVNLDDDHLGELLAAETWISPTDAVAWGFATGILDEAASPAPSQNARASVFAKLTGAGFTAICEESIRNVARRLCETRTAGACPAPAPPASEADSGRHDLSTFLAALSRGGNH